MSSHKDTVIRLCGEYPEGFEPINLDSNPNFVFTNDPGYEIVKLYDYDENSVFVNSFIECEHYVSGGWDFLPEQRNETFYHNSLLLVSALLISIGTIYIYKLSFQNDKK
tara:strand:+ start:344 stop:670 length:327 start_codon:yes stop_codon:yes gene_type:complete